MSGANGQAVPFDLDAASAAIEKQAVPFVFTYKGTVYEMRNPKLWSVAEQEALADAEGDAATSLLADLIGRDTWRALVEAGATNATIEAVMTAANEAAGVPNSSTPSKRATTARR